MSQFNSYKIAKRFIQSPNRPVQRNTTGFTNLDDPTYLGFSLFFDPYSPLLDGMLKDPAQVFASLNTQPGDNNSPGDGTVSATTRPTGAAEVPTISSGTSGCAINYLNNSGLENRAKYLMNFANNINSLQTDKAYYIQTIEGLPEAYQKIAKFGEDPYIGSSAEEGITLGLLEAIDLKITAMMMQYRLAAYDTVARRFVLPKNLRYFNVDVTVHELRNFHTITNIIRDPGSRGPEVLEFINENVSFVKFTFTDCLFLPEQSGKIFEGVTNAGEAAMATQSLKFSYGSVKLAGEFSGMGNPLNEETMTAAPGTLQSSAPKIGGNMFDRVDISRPASTIEGATRNPNLNEPLNSDEKPLESFQIYPNRENSGAADAAANRPSAGERVGDIFGGAARAAAARLKGKVAQFGGLSLSSISDRLQGAAEGQARRLATVGVDNLFGLATQALSSTQFGQALIGVLDDASNTLGVQLNALNRNLGDRILPPANQPTNNDGREPRRLSAENPFGASPNKQAPLQSKNAIGTGQNGQPPLESKNILGSSVPPGPPTLTSKNVFE